MELIVALDLPSREENLALVNTLKDEPVWVKIGLRSFIRDGKDFVRDIKKISHDIKIFLDLKLYDIPNTMGDSMEEICKIGVDMVTLHASSGKKALGACVDVVSQFSQQPLLVAVTALTSFEESEFRSIYGDSIGKKADFFASEALYAGLGGVVCSVYESKAIKEKYPKLKTVTPGIRLEETTDDQARVATPAFAKSQKSDFIVVGRPIYTYYNPPKLVKKILGQIR